LRFHITKSSFHPNCEKVEITVNGTLNDKANAGLNPVLTTQN
jgi:hypothetical protein